MDEDLIEESSMEDARDILEQLGGWRYMYGMAAVPAVVLAAGARGSGRRRQRRLTRRPRRRCGARGLPRHPAAPARLSTAITTSPSQIIPKDVPYRKAVEAFTAFRLGVVQDNANVSERHGGSPPAP